jgi:hypothetical protein
MANTNAFRGKGGKKRRIESAAASTPEGKARVAAARAALAARETMRTGDRVSVSTLEVSLFGTYVDDRGAECYGGGRLFRVRLDRSPGIVTQVAGRQVAAR